MEVEALVRKKWRLLKATMDERARRLWAGTEADAIGWGGVAAVARATSLAISTVRKGRDEARRGARSDDLVKVRRKGGGRRAFDVEHPDAWSKLEKLVDPVTRGDPESPLRWTCKSTHLLAREMFIRHGVRISVTAGDGGSRYHQDRRYPGAHPLAAERFFALAACNARARAA